MKLVEAIGAVEELINSEFAEDVNIRIDLRIELLSVFNKINFRTQHLILRDQIHKDILLAGLGPKDKAFRQFTQALILDHIHSVKTTKSFIIG